MSNQLVWLITGCSSGIGYGLAAAALKRGDKVIATARARSIAKTAPLQQLGADVLELDVAAPVDEINAKVQRALGIHGRIDVLVNNAGYILVGAQEENTAEETLHQFNTNVFSALNMSRAVLPHMRACKSGTIVWLGSIGSWRANPHGSIYGATKAMHRCLSESLNAEIRPLGLRSICVDLGYFRTSFLDPNNRAPYTNRIADYKAITVPADERWKSVNGKQPGDPAKAVELMLDLVRGEGAAAGKDLPPVAYLGSDCVEAVKKSCQTTLQRIEEWETVFSSTDFPKSQ